MNCWLKRLYARGRDDVALLKKLLHKQLNQYSLSQVDNQLFMQIVGRFGWQPFEEEINPYLIPRRGALGWLHSLLLAGVSLSGEGQSVMTRWVNKLWKPSLEYGLTQGAIANLVQIPHKNSLWIPQRVAPAISNQ